jgi:ribonuclease HI
MTLFFDGGSRGNPGISGCGYVLTDMHAVVLREGYKFIGPSSTCNQAEYAGVLMGIDRAVHEGCTALYIRGDSKLVINQLAGTYQVRHPNLKPLFAQCANALSRIPVVQFKHIPREKNSHADRLANIAMDTRTSSVM